MALTKSDPRLDFYTAVRDLLPLTGQARPTVLDLGCGIGAGRHYLGESVAYLGIERPGKRAVKGATVARGDWVRAWPYPTKHFDLAACFAPETKGPIGSVVFRAKEAVKAPTGVVVFGWGRDDRRDPEVDASTGKSFAKVMDVVFGKALVRVCTGPRNTT